MRSIRRVRRILRIRVRSSRCRVLAARIRLDRVARFRAVRVCCVRERIAEAISLKDFANCDFPNSLLVAIAHSAPLTRERNGKEPIRTGTKMCAGSRSTMAARNFTFWALRDGPATHPLSVVHAQAAAVRISVRIMLDF